MQKEAVLYFLEFMSYICIFYILQSNITTTILLIIFSEPVARIG